MEEYKNEKFNKKTISIILIIAGLVLAFCGGYFVKDLLTKKNDDLVEKDKDGTNDKKDDDLDINKVVDKLFSIYHSVHVIPKEVIAFNQLSEADFIEVSCDFYPDTVVDAINNGAGFSWCGTFTDEMRIAWETQDGQKALELIRSNTTNGIKVETLRNKVYELFGTNELKDSIMLIPEFEGQNWWLKKFNAAFVFLDKVEGTDYYAITFGSEGDPTDAHTYEMIGYKEEDNYLNIEYKIIPQYVGGEEEIRILVFEKGQNGSYKFIEDKEK